MRPLVLLDDDEAGRTRADALLKELYRGHESVVLLASVAVPGCQEIEDIIGESAVVGGLKEIGVNVQLTNEDRKSGSVVGSVRAWAARAGADLPEGWKVDVARAVVNGWVAKPPDDAGLLERAEQLVSTISARV